MVREVISNEENSVKKPNAIVKVAAVVSSVILVAGCVSSKLKDNGTVTSKPPGEPKTPTVMNSSKYSGNVVSLDVEGGNQSSSKE